LFALSRGPDPVDVTRNERDSQVLFELFDPPAKDVYGKLEMFRGRPKAAAPCNLKE